MRTHIALLVASLIAVSPITTVQAQADLFALEEDAMQAAAALVAPSVVRIDTVGGLERVGKVLVSEGPTTGLVVSADGYILSSAFNFLGEPTSVLVTLDNGTRKPAQIVARDNSRMLVLLKIESDEDLPVAEITPSEAIAVGSWSIALGRAHDAEGVSLSAGIVSAKNRIWNKAVQTDAKISPNNYGGPLIDIQGRVIGLLTPMSPQGQAHAAAGAEWYDSGIGFAVPLADIMPRLDRMKKGEDLHNGVLGVALKGKDIYNEPAVIANVRPNSPAYDAGIQANDKVVEAEGIEIVRQSQLKHVLGGKYAGEDVRLVIARGEERLEKVVTLTDKLEPFVHAMIGILPVRVDGESGVVVRHLLQDSAAVAAGMQVGDRIVSIDGQEIANYDEALARLNAAKPGDTLMVMVKRGDADEQLNIELGELQPDVPAPLPAEDIAFGGDRHELAGKGEIKLPEEKSTSLVYAPENYDPERAWGLVVWIQPPGKFEEQKLIDQWKQACAERGLILLAPHPADDARWQATETEFIRKSVAAAQDRFTIDPNRIVAFGRGAGGSMAYLLAFNQRELVRGVATVDAAVPLRGAAPDNEPTQRLSIFSAVPAGSALGDRIDAAMKVLGEKKFPVVSQELPMDNEEHNDESFAELVRWIDSLDRL